MEIESMTTVEQDTQLNKFLARFVDSGTAHTEGAIIINTLCPSRPKPLNASKGRGGGNFEEFQIIDYVSEKHATAEGLYRLHLRHPSLSISYQEWLEAIRLTVGGPVDVNALYQLLDSGDPLGTQCPNIKLQRRAGRYLTPRWLLDIEQNPVAAADGAYNIRTSNIDFASPDAFVHAAGSTVPAELNIANLTIVIYHHRGEPFNWIVVPPSHQAAFEAKIRSHYQWEIPPKPCSQFVRHLSLWITPEILTKWDIKHARIVQAPRQLIFLYPGSYIWGWSPGHCVIETRNHAGNHWQLEGYEFCDRQNPMCDRAHPDGDPIYVQPKEPSEFEMTDPKIASRIASLNPPINRRKRPFRKSPSSKTIASSSETKPVHDPRKKGKGKEVDPAPDQRAANKPTEPDSVPPYHPDMQVQHLIQDNAALFRDNQRMSHELEIVTAERNSLAEGQQAVTAPCDNLIQENSKLQHEIDIANAGRDTLINERNMIDPALQAPYADHAPLSTAALLSERDILQYSLRTITQERDDIAKDRDTIFAERDNLQKQIFHQQSILTAFEHDRELHEARVRELEEQLSAKSSESKGFGS